MKKTEKLLKIAGGRAFLDPVALAFMLPLMLVSSLLTVNHSGSLESLTVWVVANMVAFAACAVVVISLIRGPFKSRAVEPIPFLLVIAVGALLGLIKGAVTAFFAWKLGHFVDFDRLFVSRISQTTIVGLISIPALAVLGEFRFRYQEERDKLVLHKVQKALQKTKVDESNLEADEKTILLDFVRQAKSMIQENAPLQSALLIRSIIENNLRPLSHRLWNIESSKVENFKFGSLVRIGLRKYPFLWKPMVMFYAPLSFLFLLPMYGPFKALGSTVMAVLAIAIVYSAANLIKPKKSQVSVLVFGAVNAVATALVMVSPALVFEQDSTTWDAGVWLSTFILLFEIGFVSSFIAAIIANHNMNRAELSDLLHSGAANSALENRELANFLHGSVQNRLLAIALMIETNQGENPKILEELDRIEKVLFDGFINNSQQVKQPLVTALENLRNIWLGFVDLKFEYRGSEKFSDNLNETLVQLINEAITNSVRHGLAKNIQVQITQSRPVCRVVVTDDGIGPKLGEGGIGSALFDSVADRGWSLGPGPLGGTVLKLEISGRKP